MSAELGIIMTENKDLQREKLDQMWDSIGYDSMENSDSNFNTIAPRLLEFLIISLMTEDEIEIGTFSEGVKEGAIVSYDIYNSEKELNLKLMPDSVFELELLLRDEDANEKPYRYNLINSELKIIPEGLINLMKEVSEKMDAKTFRVKSLKK